MPDISVSLIVIKSQKPEDLRNFYEKLLEKKFEEHTDHGPLHYGTQIGPVYFEIYPSKEEISSRDAFGFSVKNLEATIAHVGSEYVHRAPQPSPFGRYAILKDTDKRQVHLTEQK